MTEYNVILKTPNVAPLPVSLDCIVLEDRTIIIIRGSEGLYIELHGHSSYLYPLLLKWARISNPNASYGQRVRELTVEQVVSYFEASPVLSYMADDVRQALRPAGSGGGQGLAGDIEKCRHLVGPSMADIAEILTGSRQYGGAVYTRVKAVHQALKTTTTTAAAADRQAEEAA